jgi:hypothetical protein
LPEHKEEPKEPKVEVKLSAAQQALLKAKNKALNARNDEPEPDYLAIEIPITNVIENIK